MDSTAQQRLPAPLLSLVLVVAGSLASMGCRSTSDSTRLDPSGPEPGTGIFTLVFLRTGESPPEVTDERKQELFDGHFQFMGEQAEAGHLLVAGPFGIEKAQDDLRGIFILDIDDLGAATAIAQGDPTTKAGVFRQEAHTLATLDILRQLPALEQARQEERERAGEDMSEHDVRPYVILIADEGEEAAPVLGHPAIAPAVVFFGRLGPPRDGALFCVLSLEDAKEARALLAIANEPGIAFEISEWYASPAVAKLAELGRAYSPTISLSK